MADLSGVLRKTIDGLPRATPQLRAKVYDKARAAIQRQIQAANPPLDDAVSAARLDALEDAIERTETHYASGEGTGGNVGAAPEAVTPQAQVPDAPAASSLAEPAPVPPAPPRPAEPVQPSRPLASTTSAPSATSPAVAGERRTEAPGAPMPKVTSPSEQVASAPAKPAASERPSQAPYEEVRSDWGQESRSASPLRPAKSEPSRAEPAGSAAAAAENVFPGFTKSAAGVNAGNEAVEQPFFPLASEEPEGEARPAEVGAPFITPSDNAATGASPTGREARDDRWDSEGRRLPAGIRSDDDFIPEADFSAPRYTAARKRRSSGASRKISAAAVVVLILGGLATAGWFYRDQIEALIMPPDGIDQIASTGANGNAAPGSAATPSTETPANDTKPTEENTRTAATEPAASDSTREFTQRLLPDGTEVDEGPAKAAPNAFDEGTNIAAASPVAPQVGATPTINSQIGQEPEAVGGTPAPPNPSTEAPPAGQTENAEADAGEAATPPVGQKAVFYQERTQDAAGTQESGNAVWSVVNEPPGDGQPPEPAIRANVDIPDENMSMTMTIRRNADSTLPASHVIEILFNTPANFPGGGIANVQRLALKATEQARGEPLIGVAGKISDGFFIIALNNLDQAEQSNLALLKSQQWIDIPIAYATGRRALVSIEKGVPGDEAFKQAMDAWAAKT